MHLKDFEFNDMLLSDLNCMVCEIDTHNGMVKQMGSALSFQSVVNNETYETHNLKAEYDENITAVFDIAKKVCGNHQESFTLQESLFIHKWLKQKKNTKFIPIYYNNDSEIIYYNGTFTDVQSIVVNGNIVGFKLSFTSNAPWGYVDDVQQTYVTTEENLSFNFYNDSDETGYLYPKIFRIKCKNQSKADLIIKNDSDVDNDILIDNCSPDEIITIDCQNKLIFSSIEHPKLYNDFKYNYPRMVVEYNKDVNVFTTSFPCEIEVKYAPVRKVGIFV